MNDEDAKILAATSAALVAVATLATIRSNTRAAALAATDTATWDAVDIAANTIYYVSEIATVIALGDAC